MRESERRTGQQTANTGSGSKGRRKQQQPQKETLRRANENKDSSKRGRIHLPVAGRSRPTSEQYDKSPRNRRDFSDPSPGPSDPQSSNEEQPGANSSRADYDYDNGDDDEEQGSSHEETASDGHGDEEEEDDDSERHILDLLRGTPTKSQDNVPGEGGPIGLAENESTSVGDKWNATNGSGSTNPTSAAKSPASDIDPVAQEEDEEGVKPKRMLNSSDVMFHHFKDFPVGLLALRPVRMAVDRQFIRATVQLFANTWRRFEGFPGRGYQFEGERWRRKRRRKRSVLEGEASSSTSGGLGKSVLGVNESVVNSSQNAQNQRVNPSDLEESVSYKSGRNRITSLGPLVNGSEVINDGPVDQSERRMESEVASVKVPLVEESNSSSGNESYPLEEELVRK